MNASGAAGGTVRVLTDRGPAAIAALELCGPAAGAFAAAHLRARTPLEAAVGLIRRVALLDAAGAAIDDALVIVESGPPTWRLRLCLHGNPWLVERAVGLATAAGLTPLIDPDTAAHGAAGGAIAGVPPELAGRPESLEDEAAAVAPALLTRRGVEWLGRQVGWLRAEVEDLLRRGPMADSAQHCRELADRYALLTWLTRPLRIVLAGPPNSGKSTLTNALAGRAVSLVSGRPGTTRDWVEASDEADGLPLAWIDTAGLRDAADPLEAGGIERTKAWLKAADVVVVVLDAAAGFDAASDFRDAWRGAPPHVLAINKCDLAGEAAACGGVLPGAWQRRVVRVSALTGAGLADLRAAVLQASGRDPARLACAAAWSVRQRELLMIAASHDEDKSLFCSTLKQVICAL